MTIQLLTATETEGPARRLAGGRYGAIMSGDGEVEIQARDPDGDWYRVFRLPLENGDQARSLEAPPGDIVRAIRVDGTPKVWLEDPPSRIRTIRDGEEVELPA